jgi:UDPglucose 6-dehydrogenase
MKIAVIGLWHQGSVGAACLADMGHEVVGADADVDRIATLGTGHAPLFEPGLDALIEKGLASGRLSFTTSYAEAVRDAPYVFVMFDTPVNDQDESDLTEIVRTFEAIAPALQPHAIILVTAQVPVGTCDSLAELVRNRAPASTVTFAYVPENLRLGQAIERFRAPPLPVIGCDHRDAYERLLLVLGPLAPEWHCVSLRTAEMMKHALNSFLAVNICFANELGNICDAVGADGKRIGELLRLEPRVGPRAMLSPGLGFAGGTLARDLLTLRVLGDRIKQPTPLLDGAWTSNAEQNRLVVRKLERMLPEIRGARVAVLGLTYKPDTSTLRRSAAMEVIADLGKNGAVITAHDPKVDRQELKAHAGFTFCDDPLDALTRADALVLMTPWKEYRDIDFDSVKRRMANPYVLDTAGMWDADRLTALGFVYDDIGRGRHGSKLERNVSIPTE